MVDREKVLKGLECCYSMTGNACRQCPYDEECAKMIGSGSAHLCYNALELLKEQPQWISVDDRLPDRCGNYLVCFGKGIGIRMKTACWLPEKRIWKGAEAYSTLNGITHWMPLPEPPKEVKQE